MRLWRSRACLTAAAAVSLAAAVATSAAAAAAAAAAREEAQRKREAEEAALEEAAKNAAMEEVVCGVCGDGQSTEENQIVFCEGTRKNSCGKVCGVAVHQGCYGIADFDENQKWFCDECKKSQSGSGGSKCMLCTQTSAAERPEERTV